MIHGTVRRLLVLLTLVMLSTFAVAQDRAHWTVVAPSGTHKPGETITVDLKATIDSGWHVYGLVPSDGPTPTTITAGKDLTLAGKVTEATPEKKHDPNFDVDVEFFEGSATFHVPVKLGPSGLKGTLAVRFQACNSSTCDPPKTISVPLDGSSVNPPSPAAGPTATPGDSSGLIVHKDGPAGLLGFLLTAFGAGLAALITPCVFPMIPITVSYFTKQKATQGSGAGVTHALAFCFGIVSAYSAFGLIVSALFGASSIQRVATNPWVNLVLAVIFVLLALNLFGIFSVNLPSSLQNRFSPQGKSGLIASVLMGLTFTLTSFTCTGPFVGQTLVLAASGSLVYPLLGMLAFSSAFALPFFFLALFPQAVSKLPRSGAWLEMVKGFMGFIEIGAALKFVSNADLVIGTNLISRPTFLVVWALVCFAAAAFLVGGLPVGKIEIPKPIGRARWATVAVTCLVGAWFLFGARGHTMGEVEAFLPPSKDAGWGEDYAKALTLAQRTGRPVLINFTGVTCTNCRWMEKNMFTRPDVEAVLNKYVLVELYTDRNSAADESNSALQQKLTQAVTLPEYVAVDPSGQVRKIFQGSTRQPNDFVAFLEQGSRS
jgi:thiol:disulfide interchange protein DsbD